MSYNILNKNVNFQGSTQGTIEDVVDTHSTQTVNGLKTITHLTGTNVRVTNDLVALANISASVNISASAFYGDGRNLTNVGAVTAINSATANELVTIGSTTTELDAESALTFDGSSKTLTLDGAASKNGVFNLYGTLSGSGNISGSAFYGNGFNLTGVQTALKANAGLNYSSNELEIKFDTLGTPAGGIDGAADKILIYDTNATALKQVSPNSIAALFDPVVSTFNGQTAHRVITVGGSEQIDGEENLTFDGSTLTITGNVSGSLVVSGNIGHFVTRVEAGAIALGNATGIAGAGLANNNGEVDVQVTGSVLISGNKIGITGSFAGNGLEYGGGINSIDGVSIKLESNSGLSVSPTGLKLYANNLTTTTPTANADSLVFIDADDSATKKMTFNEMATAMAGTGLDASSGTMVLDLTEVGLGATANRVLTDDGDGTVTPEANLSFDGNSLTVTGSLLTKDSGTIAKVFESSVGTSGSIVALKYKEIAHTCTTSADSEDIPNFFTVNMIPMALGVRVTTAITRGDATSPHITKIGTQNDDDSFGTFGDNDLEQSGDNLVTSYHPANATGHNTKWFTSNHELKITYNAQPAAGALRLGIYYYEITPPTS